MNSCEDKDSEWIKAQLDNGALYILLSTDRAIRIVNALDDAVRAGVRDATPDEIHQTELLI